MRALVLEDDKPHGEPSRGHPVPTKPPQQCPFTGRPAHLERSTRPAHDAREKPNSVCCKSSCVPGLFVTQPTPAIAQHVLLDCDKCLPCRDDDVTGRGTELGLRCAMGVHTIWVKVSSGDWRPSQKASRTGPDRALISTLRHREPPNWFHSFAHSILDLRLWREVLTPLPDTPTYQYSVRGRR